MNQMGEYCECGKSELDLFTLPPVNTSMERGFNLVHHPVSSLTDDTPIEFHVPSSPDEYIDLAKTQLFLKVRIMKTDGTKIGDGAHVTPVNLMLHSLFSQVDVRLRDTLVTPSVNTYAYKAYLETLLNYGSDAKKSHLTSELWYQDNGDLNSTKGDQDGNKGFQTRHKMAAGSSVIELMGRPHCDIFQQERYLLGGIDLHLKFIRSPASFHLMVDEGDFKVQIQEASLHMRKVKVNPAVSLAHAKQLDTGKFAKYPLRRGVVSTFTIPSGSFSFNKESVITGQLPRRVIVGFVQNSAYNGHLKKNPFNFQHCHLNYLSLHNGNQVVPSQPLTPQYSSDEYLQAYACLQQGMGFTDTNRGVAINRSSFKTGYALYAFDLTPDMAEGAHVDVTAYGNLRIEVHFANAPAEPVNCVVYSEYDNTIQIDRARNIITDFQSS
jgi:hypothetical protein